MIPEDFLYNKRVLVMGLGRLGGGIATTRWLVRHGAEVTVTDLQTRKKLAGSIAALGDTAEKIDFVLGEHREDDFKMHDMLVVNPAVPLSSPYVQTAREAGVTVENELTLFLRFCKNPVIGITGTRGKTTTATWVHYFLQSQFPGAVLTGNTAENAMLKVLDSLDGTSPVVVELSSFQLELLGEIEISPHIATVTNIYRDHLNRHKTMQQYVTAKANICRYQKEDDTFILKKDSEWTPHLLKQKGSSKTLFYDTEELGISLPTSFASEWGRHNVQNLKAALFAAHHAGVEWGAMKKILSSLPVPRFRQEEIYNKKGLTVINDATATTPEATIAALKRFSGGNTPVILVTGGTDKELSYDEWAGIVQKIVKPEHLILLEGSATNKMQEALPNTYKETVLLCGTLGECVKEALSLVRSLDGAIVLFSPAGTSFEKFTNEFERGERFNALIEKSLDFSR